MLHAKCYKTIPGLSEVRSTLGFCRAASHAAEAGSYCIHFSKKGSAKLVAFR